MKKSQFTVNKYPNIVDQVFLPDEVFAFLG